MSFRRQLSWTCFLVALLLHSSLLPPDTAAQEPIRVQSDEVLVPTVVFNKDLYSQLNKQKPHRRSTYGKLVAKNANLWDDIVVKNLTVRDFRLFEDGQEQHIENVKFEPPAFRVVQDNLGTHPETVGSGGGLWAYPDLPTKNTTTWLAWPKYVIAYVPPKSPVGSCHQIQVQTKRANVIVWTRGEYCNNPHSASDPLNGTPFGNKLEAAANAGPSNGIDLKLNVAAFSDGPDQARVYLATAFPAESLRHEIRAGTLYATIGSLVLIYREDGSLAARFTDFACCDYGDQKEPLASETESPVSSPSATTARNMLPNRYELQFSLAPGKYLVRAVISDGLHFGVREAPLIIDPLDQRELSLTGVVLARRIRPLLQITAEAAAVAGTYTPLISKRVEFTPTASTDFFREDTLYAYVEITNPFANGPSNSRVIADMRIVDSKSGAPADIFAPVDTTSYIETGIPVIPVGRGLPLIHLAPGVYRLKVQARDSDGHSTPWRSAEFTVLEASPLDLTNGAKPGISPLSPH